MPVRIQTDLKWSPIMLPYPPRNLQQNIQPLCWFSETAENQAVPALHVQNLAEFNRDFCHGRLPCQLEVEAADAAPVAFKAEIAAVCALVGYVQVKRVVQPVNCLCYFIRHALPQYLECLGV